MTRIAGARAVFRLDGASVDPQDAAALRLSVWDPTSAAAIDGCDALLADVVHLERRGRSFTLLMGHVDEVPALAARLRLSASVSLMDLARAALAWFGDDLPRAMLGAWLLIDWCDERRRLTIVTSINPTYPVLIARQGPRLAVSPELGDLARLSWVDDAPDGPSFAASVTSYRMHSPLCAGTMLRQVVSLPAGRIAHYDGRGERVSAVDPCLPAEPWTGSFDDAVAAAETMLRDIVRGQMARTPAVGVTLSGGLDSSILAWIASEERGHHATVPLFSSAVSTESGLLDETPYARMVADHLGEPLVPVIPPDTSPYRPRIADFRSSIRPTRLPFLHLNRDFGDRAAAMGLTHLFYGVMGELTVTSYPFTSRRISRARAAVRSMRSWWSHPDLRERWPDAAFATWLAPGLLRRLPSGWVAARRGAPERSSSRQPDAPWGYPDEMTRLLDREEHDMVQGRIRSLQPFTDIRLLRLFAGMPSGFAHWDGVDRAVARAMLRGKVPESIRLRAKGPAFAPDFHARLRRHADAAIERIPLFRQAGIGEWLDLDRIEASLRANDRFDRRHLITVFRTQYGVQMAEYLLWWLSGRPDEVEPD